MSRLNHFDAAGNAVMVAVSGKEITLRIAAAGGRIRMSSAAFEAVFGGTAAKGDVLGVARVAGIMALKRTAELIPLCHPVMTEKAVIDFELCADECVVYATCTVQAAGKTGVEMEALTGVSVALLTVYDMCKAIDRSMTIADICLLEKSGGKSGHYRRSEGEGL